MTTNDTSPGGALDHSRSPSSDEPNSTDNYLSTYAIPTTISDEPHGGSSCVENVVTTGQPFEGKANEMPGFSKKEAALKGLTTPKSNGVKKASGGNKSLLNFVKKLSASDQCFQEAFGSSSTEQCPENSKLTILSGNPLKTRALDNGKLKTTITNSENNILLNGNGTYLHDGNNNDSCPNTNTMQEGSLDNQLLRDLMNLPLSHFTEILDFDLNTANGDTCANLFRSFKSYYLCDDCCSQLHGDGKANDTYRLNCKTCSRTKSFRKMHEQLCITIETRFELHIDAPEEDGEIGIEAEIPAQAEAVTADFSKRTLETNKYNECLDVTDSHDHTMERGDLLAILKSIQSEVSRLGAKVEQLEAENAVLRKQLSLKSISEFPSLPPANSPIPSEPKVVTYSSIAQSSLPKKLMASPSPQKAAAPREPVQKRKLTDQELERFFKGLPIRPARKITALYLVGPEAGKHGDPSKKNKMRSIKDLKDMMREAFGISLSNVLHIDFIGRKLMEIHLYQDYASIFKEKILSKKFSDPWSFVDVDPLGEDLLKYSTAMDKKLEAAKRYSARLTKRLTTTPSVGHKKFLQLELDRCNLVLNPAMGPSSTMAMDASPSITDQ
jgi:hypothetical protein